MRGKKINLIEKDGGQGRVLELVKCLLMGAVWLLAVCLTFAGWMPA